MNLLNTIFFTIGFIAVAWWVLGVLIMAFGMSVYVVKGTPLSAKLISVALSGFTLPYFFFAVGRLPNGMAIGPQQMTEEEQAGLEKWMEETRCNCPNCRAARGGK